MNIGPLFKQYNALTKPRVIQLIVFCALIGMVLAVPGLPTWDEWQRMALASLGVWLVAGAAAAFNCLVEKTIDSKMRRTSWRPTAQGQLSDMQALIFSATLCSLGSFILYVWINPLTMWLTFATFVGYAVIYTLVLKPMTPQNIVIGGASGAMPPVLGWAAMTGEVGAEAAILFLIIFLWTPPHFWALALYRVEDYRKIRLAHAARHAWQRIHSPSNSSVHIFVGGFMPHALRVWHELLDLFVRRGGVEHWFYCLCSSPSEKIFR